MTAAEYVTFDGDSDPDASWLDQAGWEQDKADFDAGETTFVEYIAWRRSDDCEGATEVTDSMGGIHVSWHVAADVVGQTYSARNVDTITDDYLWSLVMDALELPSRWRCPVNGCAAASEKARQAPPCVAHPSYVPHRFRG